MGMHTDNDSSIFSGNNGELVKWGEFMEEFLAEHGGGVVAALIGISLITIAMLVFGALDMLQSRQLLLLV